MSRLLLVPLVALALAYQPPVDAPVVDEFRAPATPYGPGNRGLDYATTPGTVIGAIGAGTTAAKVIASRLNTPGRTL